MRRFEEKQGTALLKSGMSVCLLFAVDLFNTVKLKSQIHSWVTQDTPLLL